MGRLKNIVIGEPMPDKNDPKYKERYEREVEAGKRFAEKSGISWGARKVQEVGQTHKVAFLAVVFGFVFGCLIINLSRLVGAYQHGGQQPKATAIERMDSALQSKGHYVELNSDKHDEED